MQFTIRAINANDRIQELQLEALDEQEARLQVQAMGLYIAEIRLAHTFGQVNERGRFASFFKPTFSLLLFSQELRALLVAGLSLVEAIEALIEKEQNLHLLAILKHVLTGLREGKRFSQTLEEQREIFPSLYVGLIQASERTSNLVSSLEAYVDYQQRVDLIRNKLVSALVYPSILLIVGSGVTLFLMTYVVPRFAQVYKGTGRQLPMMSQLMLDWGSLLAQHSSQFLIFAILGFSALCLMLLKLWRRGSFLRLLRRLPSVGTYLHIYALTRAYLTLSMLLEGGIPISQALSIASRTVDAELKASILNALSKIQTGMILSQAFFENNLTTSISYRMLLVGERSGALGNMLNQSAAFYEGEIGRWIDRFIRGFEPILMAIIGIIVGAIVLLLYMPIFDLADGLS